MRERPSTKTYLELHLVGQDRFQTDLMEIKIMVMKGL